MVKNCDLDLENAAAWYCIDIFRRNYVLVTHGS